MDQKCAHVYIHQPLPEFDIEKMEDIQWPEPQIRAIQYELSVTEPLVYFDYDKYVKLKSADIEPRPDFSRLVELEKTDFKVRTKPLMGGIKEITIAINAVDWFRARDVALILKADIIEELKANEYHFDAPLNTYPFDLIQLKAVVCSVFIIFLFCFQIIVLSLLCKNMYSQVHMINYGT